jgi:hypothetical protein
MIYLGLFSLKEKIQEREVEKCRLHLSESISKEKYMNKRKSGNQMLAKKQNDLMDPFTAARLTKRKQDEEENSQYFNL